MGGVLPHRPRCLDDSTPSSCTKRLARTQSFNWDLRREEVDAKKKKDNTHQKLGNGTTRRVASLSALRDVSFFPQRAPQALAMVIVTRRMLKVENILGRSRQHIPRPFLNLLIKLPR